MQIDHATQSIQFSLFPVEVEGYGEPFSSSHALEGIVIIAQDSNFFHKLNDMQLTLLLDSLDTNTSMIHSPYPQLGFVTLNGDTGGLWFFICELVNKKFRCENVKTKQVKEEFQIVKCMQVHNLDVLIILRNSVNIIPLNLTKPTSTFTYENRFAEIHKFHDNWYGISNNFLWVLFPGEGVDKTHLSEKLFFINKFESVLVDLEVTENLLIIQYFRSGTETRGVRVLTLDDKGIFARSNYTADDLLRMTPNLHTDLSNFKSKKQFIQGSASRMLEDISHDFPFPSASLENPSEDYLVSDPEMLETNFDYSKKTQIVNYFEFNGHLVMFGQGSSSLLIYTLAPTITTPPGLSFSSQPFGNLNSSYSIKGSSIVQVIPSCNNNSLTVLATREASNSEEQSEDLTTPDQLLSSEMDSVSIIAKPTVLYMYDVKIGSPILELERVSADDLASNKTLAVDIFYLQYPNYVQKRYIINFVNVTSYGSLWMYTAVGIIILILLSIIGLCIMKSKKVLTKAHNEERVPNTSIAIKEGDRSGNWTLPEASKDPSILQLKDKLMTSQ